MTNASSCARARATGQVQPKTDFRLVKDDLPFLGDGGFTWDVLGSEAAAFRKDNYLIFVSVPLRPHDYKEMRLSRQFAERVAEVLGY